ncbi:hypothetical protein AMTRI_Chr01g112670 [Amborella trichopoda]|uniref:G domain-containing protein n=1 Tax=Amborella trichopoda TaxID=13333 RepID=W1PFA6_AMBTC|nr:uncharacterized protein LOC110007319 [Amborella trichopoda]ERN06648.1 hypothetical protein AMTR_s00058p00182990 [Amborella trichopoda]|eukprot:XP_020523248.1 uncharacterized protein LOC110007319 [Amborella trichopoda]
MSVFLQSRGLLLRLLGTSLTGILTFIACKRLNDQNALHAQYLEIQNALSSIPNISQNPPTIFLLGFHDHGKSSLVNTMCRVLYGEEGPLILRAETAPHCLLSTTSRHKRVSVRNPFGGNPENIISLVDTPPLPAADKLLKSDVKTLLKVVPENQNPGGGMCPVPECVVLVLGSKDVMLGKLLMKKLPEIVSVLREEGLQFVVVLTHKRALKNRKEAEFLQNEVARRARSDCVYVVENYTASANTNNRRPVSVKNDFDTHNKILAIIRQCLEFVATYRSTTLTSKGA